jgi:HK97 family phage major capsid protein
MSEQQIETREAFVGLLEEALPDLIKKNPQFVLDALVANREAMVESLRNQGLFVSTEAASARTVINMRDEAVAAGRILGGFGARTRESVKHLGRRYYDPVRQKERITYLSDPEIEASAERWIMAMLQKDYRHPATGEHARELADKLNEASKVRAPSTPITTEVGTSGGILVPTVVAAEIFEETTERFVLRGLVQIFTSAQPLRIPRRIALITVSRGAPATDLDEADPNILGAVNLSPERVGALAYIEPRLAQAAAVGPVRWIIQQFAEAIARDDQRVIVAGDANLREPTGINTLPTADANAYDNIKSVTWDNTSNATRRAGFREMLYSLSQYHRMQPSYRWIGNADLIAMASGLNDSDSPLFFRDAEGQNPERILNRGVVETTSLATSGDATTVLCGDLGQYAWQEVPGGLRMEQTEVGGQAWESDTIGIKVVQEVDGAPVIPPAFCKMASVDV